MADFIDEATSNEMAERFVRRVAEAEAVYWLRTSNGCAQSESSHYSDDEGEPRPVLLFFSDAAYARAVQKTQYPDHELAQMALFDFLYRCLAGMSRDRVVAGLNWRADLCGPERDPFELCGAIEEALPPEVRTAHQERRRRVQ
jgi:Protein of unknown function (DUF2750)